MPGGNEKKMRKREKEKEIRKSEKRKVRKGRLRHECVSANKIYQKKILTQRTILYSILQYIFLRHFLIFYIDWR